MQVVIFVQKIFYLIKGKPLTLPESVIFLKKLKYNNVSFSLCIVFLLLVITLPVYSQQRSRTNAIPLPDPKDSTALPADTARINADSLRRDIETTIKYTARDSVITDLAKKTAYLYGDAKVTYGDVNLEADIIEINYETNQVDARGRIDSTGKMVGIPKFKGPDGEYESKGIVYNFKTKKGVISQVVTQQGDGFIHGTTVKKDAENNMYVGDAVYTTCNLAHPHFHISANKIKVVHEKQIVTGPFNLVINDVPTPLGFAFGIFPFLKKKPNGTSGIIFPTYGEEPRDRGFFLRDGGYYWAVNEHIGMSVLGEIYSRGGWGLNLRSNYKQRYAYSGNLDLRFNRRRNGEEGFQDVKEDFWITWSHIPESRGTGRFSASVNAGTSSYNERNAREIERRISPSFNSNVSYSNSLFGGAVTYGVNLRHDMNAQTGVMNLTLPDVNLSVTRIFPFKGKNSSGKNWYETIGFSYQFSGSNRLSNIPRAQQSTFSGLRVYGATTGENDVIPFNVANLSQLMKGAEIGARHSIPVSMSLKLFKYFSVNPSFSYNETWYPQKFNYEYLVQNDTSYIAIDTLRGFQRSYSYNASAGITTNIYGMFYFKNKNSRLEAIRHRMIPNVSLNYQPDFSRDRYGFYQNVQVAGNLGVHRDSLSPESFRYISRFQNSTFGSPSIGESGSISFSLNNTFEAKLRAKSDSAGAKSEKVSILDNLGISTSYNLAADSMHLSPINIATRTRILKTDVNFTMQVDPYAYERYTDAEGRTSDSQGRVLQRRIKEYAWNANQGIGQITSANMFFSKSFSPSDKKKGTASTDSLNTQNMSEAERQQLAFINANRERYVDFNVPWTISFSYSLNYTKQGFNKPVVSQTLSFSGDLKITDKWKVSYNSGYDFVNKGIINTTSFNIHRDLHCWEMLVSWTPFGIWQSYSFDLRVKSSILQDLKLSRRRSWYDR